jgi:DNA-binding NarL/FixJ family response regulator
MIRVFLIDDHLSFRQPLGFIIEHQADMSVAGQAGSLAETRAALADAVPFDVAIVDLGLPDGNGVDLVRELRRRDPAVQILVLSGFRRQEIFEDAVAAGANGVMKKSVSVDQILDGVRRLHKHEPLLSATEVASMIQKSAERGTHDEAARAALATLTPREREVLQALADGLNDKDIAERLHISSDTVRRHMTNLLTKLEVESRLQALVFAIRHGAVRVE